MGLFRNRKKGGVFADVIRCDEPSYLIWKWHPNGSQLSEGKKEYSIRWGSKLRVKDGEVAVFVYKHKNGEMQDFIVGPFDQTLKTANLPILTGLLGLLYNGDTPFQAEVYFINLAKTIQVKFAVPFFDIYDPRYVDFGVPVAVRGTVTFGIDDYREFIKLHRLDNFDLNEFQLQIRDAVSRYVKDAVANAPAAHNIPVVQIESKIATINDDVEFILGQRLRENFGVCASGIDIGVIEIDKTSNGYSRLVAITQDVTTEAIKARTAADVENYAETLRIQREEAQYAQHMQTKTANIGAYQIEKQTEVGVAGAQALGEMGANNAGSVDLGGGSTGFNPAAMMASMAVGGVVGQNIAGIMNGALNNTSVTPPPVPQTAYYLAVNGQSAGPYLVEVLAQMGMSGTFTKESLVWKQGMTEWTKAEAIQELQSVFGTVPPAVPK